MMGLKGIERKYVGSRKREGKREIERGRRRERE